MSSPAAESTIAEPVARSPIRPTPPVAVVAGWEVSARTTEAALTLTDETPLAKVQVKAPWDGAVAAALGVAHGRAETDSHGTLVVGSGPGEWLALAAPATAEAVTERLQALRTESASGELVTIVDLTHGRALLRLTGEAAPEVLAKVCAIDLADDATPPGAAFRTSVAKLVTDVIYQSRGSERSYLLHCERSSGRYLFDALLDAGAEFDIDVAGFVVPDERP